MILFRACVAVVVRFVLWVTTTSLLFMLDVEPLPEWTADIFGAITFFVFTYIAVRWTVYWRAPRTREIIGLIFLFVIGESALEVILSRWIHERFLGRSLTWLDIWQSIRWESALLIALTILGVMAACVRTRRRAMKAVQPEGVL